MKWIIFTWASFPGLYNTISFWSIDFPDLLTLKRANPLMSISEIPKNNPPVQSGAKRKKKIIKGPFWTCLVLREEKPCRSSWHTIHQSHLWPSRAKPQEHTPRLNGVKSNLRRPLTGFHRCLISGVLNENNLTQLLYLVLLWGIKVGAAAISPSDLHKENLIMDREIVWRPALKGLISTDGEQRQRQVIYQIGFHQHH